LSDEKFQGFDAGSAQRTDSQRTAPTAIKPHANALPSQPTRAKGYPPERHQIKRLAEDNDVVPAVGVRKKDEGDEDKLDRNQPSR
jgi:hypothetical protein